MATTVTAEPVEGEARRNRLLRRVDWRFLLDAPRPRVSVSFGDDRLAEALALVSDEHVDLEHAKPGRADLAVAVDPPADVLRASHAALQPEGAFYSEWSSPLRGGRRRVRRRIEAAGFADVAFYWAWPRPHRGTPNFWLPLEAPAALAWFLQTRPRPRSVVPRLIRSAAYAAFRAAARVGLLYPLLAVATKAGPCEEDRPQRMSWVLLTGGRRTVSKPVGVVFAERARRPRLVVKFARVEEAEPALEREWANLKGLQTLRPGIEGVPRVVFLTQNAGVYALGETVEIGRPLSTLLRPKTFEPLARAVTRRLIELAAPAAPVAQEEWWGRIVGVALAGFERQFGVALTGRELEAAHRRLETLGDLPLVPEQRDCSPWNVLLADDGQLVLLDWESAELHGLPALDLVYFLTHAAFFAEGATRSKRFAESYARLLDPSTRTGAVFERCVGSYARQLGLDPRVVPGLRLLTWTVHAHSDYERLRADAAAPPELRALSGSLFLTLWRYELECAP